MLEFLFDFVFNAFADVALSCLWRLAYWNWEGESKAMQWINEGRHASPDRRTPSS